MSQTHQPARAYRFYRNSDGTEVPVTLYGHDAADALTRYARDGGDLRHMDMRSFDLSAVDLSNCDLSGVAFDGCTLVGANLSNTRISRTNFEMAFLQNADLKWSQGRHTNFRNAHILGADFRGSKLYAPNLKGADWQEIAHAITDGKAPSAPHAGVGGPPGDVFRGSRIARPRADKDRKLPQETTRTLRAVRDRQRNYDAFKLPLSVMALDMSGIVSAGELLQSGLAAEDWISENLRYAYNHLQKHFQGYFLGGFAAVLTYYGMRSLIDETIGRATSHIRTGFQQMTGLAVTSHTADHVRSMLEKLGNRAALVFTRHRQTHQSVRDALTATQTADHPEHQAFETATGYVIVCDRNHLREAIEEIDLRLTTGQGVTRQDRLTILDADAAGSIAPTAVVWQPDGRKSAVWTDHDGRPARVAHYQRGADEPAVVENINNGPPIDTPKVFSAAAREMRRNAELRRKSGHTDDMPYPPDTHTISRFADGKKVVYDTTTGYISNPLGPAIRIPTPDEGYVDRYFIDGVEYAQSSHGNRPMGLGEIMPQGGSGDQEAWDPSSSSLSPGVS